MIQIYYVCSVNSCFCLWISINDNIFFFIFVYCFLNFKTKVITSLKPLRWLPRDSNLQPPSSFTNTQPFGQTGQMTKLCCEYLPVRCIWLYVFIMSRIRFRVNPHSIVAWMSRFPFSKQARYLKFKSLQRDSNPQPLSS